MPKYDIRKALLSPRMPVPLPPLRYGREEHNRLWVNTPTNLGDLTIARSAKPNSIDTPVVITSPRLSPHYRVPAYLPPSSARGSRSPVKLSPISPRETAEEAAGMNLYEAASRSDVAHMTALVTQPSKSIPLDVTLNFQRPAFSDSPLSIAVNNSQMAAVHVLIAAGADIDQQDKFGCTPLHFACRRDDLPMVKLLVFAGASLDVLNKHGHTPLEASTPNSSTQIWFTRTFPALEKAGRKAAVATMRSALYRDRLVGELCSSGHGFASWIASKHAAKVLDAWAEMSFETLAGSPHAIAGACRAHFGGYVPPADLLGWLCGLATMAETLPIAFTVSDPTVAGFPLIFVNEKFCEVTGYSKAESYGRNCRFLQGPGTNAEHGQKLRDDLRDGSVSQTMLLNYRKSGEAFENLLTMRYVHDSHGRRRYCIGLQLDLTGLASESGPWGQRRLASASGRELIAEASTRMLKLASLLPKAIEVPPPSPPPSAPPLPAPPPPAPPLEALDEVPTPEADEEAPPPVAAAKAHDSDDDNARPDGGLTALAAALSIDGDAVGDATLPWAARLSALVDGVPIAAIVVDMTVPGLPISHCNAAFEALSGWAKADAIGQNCRFLQGPKTEAAPLSRLISAVREGTPLRVALTNHRRDGTPFRNDLSLHPVRDSTGLYRYNVGILTEADAKGEAAACEAAAGEAADEAVEAAAGETAAEALSPTQILRSGLPSTFDAALDPLSVQGAIEGVGALEQMRHFHADSSRLVRLLWSTDTDGALRRLLRMPDIWQRLALSSLGRYLSSDAMREKQPHDELRLRMLVTWNEWHAGRLQHLPPIELGSYCSLFNGGHKISWAGIGDKATHSTSPRKREAAARP